MKGTSGDGGSLIFREVTIMCWDTQIVYGKAIGFVAKGCTVCSALVDICEGMPVSVNCPRHTYSTAEEAEIHRNWAIENGHDSLRNFKRHSPVKQSQWVVAS
jgi:hypothetical protein